MIERIGELACVVEAALGLARDGASEPCVERGRQLWREVAGHGDRLDQDSRENVAERRAVERESPGQALERDGAERPEVGAQVDRVGALRLLGAHVRRRPEDLAHLGASARPARELRDAEIDELRDLVVVLAGEEDVLGLQIAVDDSHGVRAREASRDLSDDTEGGGDVELADELEARRQVFADEPLHRDERNALPEVVVEDADDMRALDLRDRPRFEREAGSVACLARGLGAHELHGAADVERQVLGEPDGAHGPTAQLAHELEAVGDDASGGGVHARRAAAPGEEEPSQRIPRASRTDRASRELERARTMRRSAETAATVRSVLPQPNVATQPLRSRVISIIVGRKPHARNTRWAASLLTIVDRTILGAPSASRAETMASTSNRPTPARRASAET